MSVVGELNKEESCCVSAIANTLKQVAQALNLNARGIDKNGKPTAEPKAIDDIVVVGDHNSEVSLDECCEFIDLIANMILNSGDDYERVHAIVFNTDATLMPTLITILQFPPTESKYKRQDDRSSILSEKSLRPMERLSLSAMKCIKRIVSFCCMDTYCSPRRTNDGQMSPLSTLPPLAVRLSTLCGNMIVRSETYDLLVQMLNPAWPSEVCSEFAAELLFCCVLRIPAFIDVLVQPELPGPTPHIICLLDVVVKSAKNERIRSYITASLREIIGKHPEAIGKLPEVIETLVTLMTNDSVRDIRAMSTEAIEVIFRNEPQLWQRCGLKKEIATAVVARLEDNAEEDDVLLAVLKLIETLLIADAALLLGKPLRGPSLIPDQSGFTESFLNLRGDRALISTIKATTELDAFCARCLRLLVEFAPHYRAVSYQLFRHNPSLAAVLKLCVDLALDESGLQTVSDMRFELSLAVGLLLCQDPRSRAIIISELSNNTAWMAQLRGALLSNLNSSALSDFSGIRIIDVMGFNMCDVNNVEWNESEQPIRPIRSSLEDYVEQQNYRFLTFAENNYVHTGAYASEGYVREIPAPDPHGESNETRLTFILLTNTIHNTLNVSTLRNRLKDNKDVFNELLCQVYAPIGKSTEKDYEESVRRMRSMENVREPSYGSNKQPCVSGQAALMASHHSRRGYQAYNVGSVPPINHTRTSLIREWANRPEHFNRIKQKSMTREQDNSEYEYAFENSSAPANFFGGGSNENYTRRNFENLQALTDPYKQPTEESFKQPTKTIQSLIAKQARTGEINVTEERNVYTKFDASLDLCKTLGRHFSTAELPIRYPFRDKNTSYFEATGDGMVKRQASRKNTSVGSNPGTMDVSKTWNTNHLKEGDLFYFSVPFNSITAFAIEQVRLKAVRHLNHLKRSYIVTPQNMKRRRWFIYDMTVHIMPKVICALEDIQQLIELHGEENVRFPMIMFREDEMAKKQLQNSGYQASQYGTVHDADAVHDASLNSGNLMSSLDQLQFYLSKSGAETMNTTATTTTAGVSAVGMDPRTLSSIGGKASQTLVDIDNKIRILKTRKFNPSIDAKFTKVFSKDRNKQMSGNPPHDDDEYEVSDVSSDEFDERIGGSYDVKSPNVLREGNTDGDNEVSQCTPKATVGRSISRH